MDVGDVVIHLLHRVGMFLKETRGGTTQERNAEQRFEKTNQHPASVEETKENENAQHHGCEETKDDPKQRGHQVKIENGKKHCREKPQANVGENVHHGVKNHGGHGVGNANVGTEFHDAIGTAAETKGGGITKGKTGDGEFVGVTVGKVALMASRVHNKLKSTGVEGIDNDPHAKHAGQIETGVAKTGEQNFFLHLHREAHHDNGCESEEEEEVTTKFRHIFS